ncbi:MAG: hypothetical protein ACOCVN_01045, partial [bacterium]
MKYLQQLLIFILILITCEIDSIKAQVSVSGVINNYTKIKQVFGTNKSDPDTILVNDIIGFSPGDTVLMIQMKGAEPTIPGGGIIFSIKNTGLFEILLIKKILTSTKEIILTTSINKITNFSGGEYGQLVRVPSYNKPVITGELKCTPWNPVNGFGGIIAFIARGGVTLEADINASAMGYQGGDPSGDLYPGECSGAFAGYTEPYFTSSAVDSAGIKGEGIEPEGYEYTRGRGRLINAGGGGYGKHSGGGGGGNYGRGGNAGYETASCGDSLEVVGGGIETTYYLNDPYKDRIFMGGGGGCGTQTNAGLATRGGNGGGIIILIADTLRINSGSILARGESITDSAYAGGGGGGGGGAIILDVDKIEGNLAIDICGGNGGNTYDVNEKTGPGGGGGGGVLWTKLSSFPSNVTINKSGGSHGRYDPHGNETFGSSNGGQGTILYSRPFPLRVFLYNLMPLSQVICAGEIPGKLVASSPKGGDGNYSFIWQEKSTTSSWKVAKNTFNQKDYQPPALLDTTFYRRIVVSDNIYDTSEVVAINVQQNILNDLQDDQEICEGEIPLAITSSDPTGGDMINYSFSWEESSNTNSWSVIPGVDTRDYTPQALTSSRFYRRIILSGNCTSISDTIKVTVYPALAGNEINPEHTTCLGTEADTLNTKEILTGGTGAYSFQWKEKTSSSSWILLAGKDKEFLLPGILTENKTFKREVQSGPCFSTSNSVDISILPFIENNEITGNQEICFNEIPDTIHHQNVLSGGTGNYQYSWIYKTGEDNWILKNDNLADWVPPALKDTTLIKRIVYSGVCIDTSNQVQINVYDSIVNRLISDDQELCHGEFPSMITGAMATGGDNTNYIYQWEERGMTSSWHPASGINTNVSYFPGTTSSKYFRRKVISSSCDSYSKEILVLVLDSIQNNIISGPDRVCLQSDDWQVDGSLPNGGNGNYKYYWQKKQVVGEWFPVGNEEQNFPGDSMSDTLFMRRIVMSGEKNSCIDTSNFIRIDPLPLPEGNLINVQDTVCSGDEYLLNVELSGNDPFNVEVGNEFETFKKDSLSSKDSIIVIPRNSSIFTIKKLEDKNKCIAASPSGEAIFHVYQVPSPSAGTDGKV